MQEGTYHCYKRVCLEELRNLCKLVLEVVDPDVANVGAFTRVPVQVRQLVLVVLLEEEGLGAQIQRLLLLLLARADLR